MTQQWPAYTVERWSIDRLKPYDRNARKHSALQVEQLRGAMRTYGWTVPILAREDGTVVAGHGRLEAGLAEGYVEVPVIVARGWTDDQCRAYALADNKIALNAEWDAGILKGELADLDGLGVDLGSLGFSPLDLAAVLDTRATGLTDADEPAPAPPETPIAAVGDLWAIGRHRLLCGDATRSADVTRALAGSRPHLMVTDPPYGVDYEPAWRAEAGVNNNLRKLGEVTNDERADWHEAWALFPGDVAYVWHAGRYASTVQASLEAARLLIRAQIIWGKDRFALSRGDYHWQHEPCWYAVRDGATGHWSGDRSQATLWQIATREDGGHGHGTQKPVECMKRPIENNSRPGDAIYDPFVGSGTTIIAAEMTGRRCHAIEINPAYVDVTIMRWEQFTGEQATLDGDGRTFAEIGLLRNDTRTQADRSSGQGAEGQSGQAHAAS